MPTPPTSSDCPALVLGPMLRHVDGRAATVWVETDRPCEVTVTAGAASGSRATFTVHGHHYALVDVAGLPPGSATPYTVTLDGTPAWPEPGSALPPSLIRVPDPTGRLRVAFGSCRTSVPHDPHHERTHGVDVLRTMGIALAEGRIAAPDVVLFVGDQVYADEPSPEMRELLAARRDLDEPPGAEMADFEDYTQLYRVAWSDPVVRWLLSTVSTGMVFDDHDVRDDWNTSTTWRADMEATSWWRARITGALSSYWVYQHAGNLSVRERAGDAFWQAAYGGGDRGEACGGGDRGEAFDRLAWLANCAPDSYRWSFERDLGRVRLVVVDSRAGRMLEPGKRAMLDAAEWAWFDERARGDVDHLLVGTSLPVFLPRGVHDVQRWDEAVTDEGAWGGRVAGFGEWLRQFLDLEHWAAFERSFALMERVVTEVATGRRGAPPASMSFLSGDVHYSYLADVAVPGGAATAVHQLTCSPIRNPLSPTMRLLNVVSQFGLASAVGRGLAATAGIGRPALDWDIDQGPWFDNAMCVLDLDGREGTATWLSARRTEPDREPVLVAREPIDLGGPVARRGHRRRARIR